MQRRARQMRDGRLQSVKAIIERQQRMPSKGDDHCLLLDGQDGRSGLLRSWRRSATDARFRHFATVFGLTPKRLASALKLS